MITRNSSRLPAKPYSYLNVFCCSIPNYIEIGLVSLVRMTQIIKKGPEHPKPDVDGYFLTLRSHMTEQRNHLSGMGTSLVAQKETHK
jgi:hypothetical protein